MDWNPFKEINHQFYRNITIEWGIYTSSKKFCPWAVTDLFRAIDIVDLTSEMKDDLVKYTCSSACGDDANICDNRYTVSVQDYGIRSNTRAPDLPFLAINHLKVADSCLFNTSFGYSLKFCSESWSGVQTVDVPQEIQGAYPQFITMPELYRFDYKHLFPVPKSFCNEMWNSSID